MDSSNSTLLRKEARAYGTDREDRVRGIEAGADEFLNKPIFAEELFARVKSLLKLKEFTDELENADSVLCTLGLIVEGMLALVIDGVAHELGPMAGYVLPGGVEHSAYCGPEGALVLDVFQPVREDYLERAEQG